MRSVYLITLFLLLSYFGFGQEFQIPDSLKNKSFEELGDLLDMHYRDSLKFAIYGNTMLAKGKQENNLLAQAKGYKVVSFSYSYNAPIWLAYLDSSIAVSKGLNDKLYPAVSYSIKGGVYRQIKEYDKALDSYLSALSHSREVNNLDFYYLTKYNIGSLKERIGELEEAGKIYKEVLQYENKNNIDSQGHYTTMYRLATVYRKLQLFDSATIYNKKGIKESLKKDLDIYHFFVLNEGINLFNRQDYQASADSIKKGLFVIEKLDNVSVESVVSSYLHLARIYEEFNHEEEYLEYLKKIDEFYKLGGYVTIEMREGYKMLINYYKSKKDKNKQLYYINQFVKVDSLLDKQYKNLNKKITKEFDTPNLLREKEELIALLEAEKGVSSNTIVIISLLLVISLGGVSYYYYNQRRYKKRFLQLLETNTQQNSSKEKPPKNKTEISSISPETLEHLLAQLRRFEERQGYLSSKINSKDLAKSFGSNSSYLSLVINTYKKKSLSQYLNDLRIDFAVEKLQSDARFRKYTIKAIAQEVGFKTAEAFAKTFYKKTGIYPSYFIKKLERQGSETST